MTPGGGVGSGGRYKGWCPGIPNLVLLDMLVPPDRMSSPPFIPSTRASIISTPDIGAATTTGKRSNDSSDEFKSTGVRGGVSVY